MKYIVTLKRIDRYAAVVEIEADDKFSAHVLARMELQAGEPIDWKPGVSEARVINVEAAK